MCVMASQSVLMAQMRHSVRMVSNAVNKCNEDIFHIIVLEAYVSCRKWLGRTRTSRWQETKEFRLRCSLFGPKKGRVVVYILTVNLLYQISAIETLFYDILIWK